MDGPPLPDSDPEQKDSFGCKEIEEGSMRPEEKSPERQEVCADGMDYVIRPI